VTKKGQEEAINRGKTDKTMVKRERQIRQIRQIRQWSNEKDR